MKQVAIITENFIYPWWPNDIDTFLGGSQEVVVLLAEALKKSGYFVAVYTYNEYSKTKAQIRDNIVYSDFSFFDYNFETIILFKVNPLNEEKLKGDYKPNIIFWSSDIQNIMSPNNNWERIKSFVCLTMFHKQRNETEALNELQRKCWKNSLVIPHGADFDSLNKNKVEKKANTVLYSSSYDRGLETLLNSWGTIKTYFPNLKLKITYGFNLAKQFIIGEENRNVINENETKLKEVALRLGVEYLGNIDRNSLEKLYWESEYWILPLNKADSELFCLNAIKAQYCGCIPIVNKIGALSETVGNYIPFNNFIKGNKTIQKGENIVSLYSWNDVVNLWKPIL